jgi:diphosphomevalonate decarboxylase
MGKEKGNIPCNSSLSYTLNKFFTQVSLENCSNDDEFINEIGLNEQSCERFLQHLKNIKKLFNYDGFFRVKSFNNFPHSAGMASSSSSFAALTRCALTAICEINGKSIPSPEKMSEISREASGASCRSFFSPWSIWDRERARGINLKIGELNHDLILIDKNPKKISSSEAHALVRSSPLFEERPSRAKKRLDDLIDSLNNDRWIDACQICWEEVHDIHELFATSSPEFCYIQPKTIIILEEIKKIHGIYNDGPIVTMDAGPNIHLLWRKNQGTLRQKFKNFASNALNH